MSKIPIHVLVDADTFPYRAGYAGQSVLAIYYSVATELVLDTRTGKKAQGEFEDLLDHYKIDWVKCHYTYIKPLEQQKEILDGLINNVVKGIKELYGNNVVFEYFGSDSRDKYFRNDIASIRPYKGNRESSGPVRLQELFEHMKDKVYVYHKDKCEGDDAVAMRATELWDNNVPYIVCSNDKDLKQIPGIHYDPYTKKVTNIDERDANRFLYEQILSGDYVDNVLGIPRIGPKIAANLLSKCITDKQLRAKCIELYAKYARKLGGDNRDGYDMYLETRCLVELIKDEKMYKERVSKL